MVHFEFGQDRLTQPHPLKASEWPQGAIKGAPGAPVLPVRQFTCIYIYDRMYIQGVEANGTVYHIDQAR